jgi:hypothetical protein
MTAPTPTLTPLAYRALSLFADGMSIQAIAEATGQGWYAVRQVVNVHADGHRTNARRVIDAHPPMPPEDVDQAVADSLAKAAPKQKPAPKPKAKPAASSRADAEPDPPKTDAAILAGWGPLDVLADAKAVTHRALEATDTDPDLPEPDISDLATLDGLLSAAAELPAPVVGSALTSAAEKLDELRRLVRGHRRRELVAAEIAACEARLAKLRQWEGTS